MKPRISKKGAEILRDCNLARAVMMCWIHKKYKRNPNHPMLFEISTIDINNEAERLKNN